MTPDDSARARALALYHRTAARTCHEVLAGYSTSFGLGSRVLPVRQRRDIEAVYALVRIADEVVDTRGGADAAQALDELEGQVDRALVTGWSTNLVVHAFARTARRVGIDAELIDPFFASMRADLTIRVHDEDSYRRYIYGSAEVVGLMCLAVFLNADRRPGDPLHRADPDTVAGARALGAAFQKVNFLRDLAADTDELGRRYFPGVGDRGPDQQQYAAILADIAADVDRARRSLPALPARPRAAVAVTLGLYDRLLAQLAELPPEQVRERRVRVSTPRKLMVLGRTLAGELSGGGR